jgi:hypothetical protein
MPPAGLEPAIPEIEGPKTYAFTSFCFLVNSYVQMSVDIFFKAFISDSSENKKVRRFILNFLTNFLGPVDIHSIAKLREANSMALL